MAITVSLLDYSPILDETHFFHQDPKQERRFCPFFSVPRLFQDQPSQFHAKESLFLLIPLLLSDEFVILWSFLAAGSHCVHSFHSHCSHAGFSDALVVLEGLVVVELPLVPLVMLLPLQHREQALKKVLCFEK